MKFTMFILIHDKNFPKIDWEKVEIIDDDYIFFEDKQIGFMSDNLIKIQRFGIELTWKIL